jgi:hypothetical protein
MLTNCIGFWHSNIFNNIKIIYFVKMPAENLQYVLKIGLRHKCPISCAMTICDAVIFHKLLRMMHSVVVAQGCQGSQAVSGVLVLFR